jgi:hypothetical protein
VFCSVSIYPLDERAVQLQDGSLPVMSYWYGKVLEIYLNPGGQVKESTVYVKYFDGPDRPQHSNTGCMARHQVVLSQS